MLPLDELWANAKQNGSGSELANYVLASIKELRPVDHQQKKKRRTTAGNSIEKLCERINSLNLKDHKYEHKLDFFMMQCLGLLKVLYKKSMSDLTGCATQFGIQ